MNERGRVVEQLCVVQQQFFGEHGFAAPRGSHDQNTGRGVKTERSSHHDAPPHTNDTLWVQVYTFLFTIFNNNVDDEGFDTVCGNPARYKSTVSLLRQLCDHCLHNRDVKSH